MQIFDAGLTNKNSGIHQQMPLTAKCRPIFAVFSTSQIKNIVQNVFEIVLIFYSKISISINLAKTAVVLFKYFASTVNYEALKLLIFTSLV